MMQNLTLPTSQTLALGAMDANKNNANLDKANLAEPNISFEKILRLNKTLIYLNLYNCNLSDNAGMKIVEGLEFNNTLVEFDLGYNLLGDKFCNQFKEKMRFNKTVIPSL